MTDSAVKTEMLPETQIDVAIREGMTNIAMAIMGEMSLQFDMFVHRAVGGTKDGVTLYEVVAKVTDQIGQVTFESLVPIRHPDENCFLYRIDDVSFEVRGGTTRLFESWCEHNTAGEAIAITRCLDGKEPSWIVSGTIDDEILHLGNLSSMPPQFRLIVGRIWPKVVALT